MQGLFGICISRRLHTVEVKKNISKNVHRSTVERVPTAKWNSGNGKRRLTVHPLTVPFFAYVCHAHFSLATRVHYPEVAKVVLTLHEPWQRPTAPKALKNLVDFDAIVRLWRGSSRVTERDRERSMGKRLNGVSVETGKR